MVKGRIIIIGLLIMGVLTHEMQAIKPQTWAFVTGAGVVTGATTAAVIYHFAKKKPSHHQKPKNTFKTIVEYLGISTLGGLLGGTFTGTLGYFFTPYYRLRCAKSLIEGLQNCPLVTNQFAQVPLYNHINGNSLQDYPLAATFVDLTYQKTTVDNALDYLSAAKKDTHDATMLNTIGQTENTAKLMQANAQTHINLLRQHPNFDKQLTQHRIAQREAIRLRNETKYANAAERSSHALQTSANAQTMHGASDVIRTVNGVLRQY